jgi:hypothetical protein
MATYSKRILSGSTSGKQIALNANSSTPTLIHTAVSGSSSFDEVWLYVTNIHTEAVTLTLRWGGSTSADEMVLSIPSKTGRYLIVDGKLLNGALEIRGYGSTASVLNVDGYVNRIE